MSSQTGFWGKVPAERDFFGWGFETAAHHALEEWVRGSAEGINPRTPSVGGGSEEWSGNRVLLWPEEGKRELFIGAVVPSRDREGRRMPLVLGHLEKVDRGTRRPLMPAMALPLWAQVERLLPPMMGFENGDQLVEFCEKAFTPMTFMRGQLVKRWHPTLEGTSLSALLGDAVELRTRRLALIWEAGAEARKRGRSEVSNAFRFPWNEALPWMVQAMFWTELIVDIAHERQKTGFLLACPLCPLQQEEGEELPKAPGEAGLLSIRTPTQEDWEVMVGLRDEDPTVNGLIDPPDLGLELPEKVVEVIAKDDASVGELFAALGHRV